MTIAHIHYFGRVTTVTFSFRDSSCIYLLERLQKTVLWSTNCTEVQLLQEGRTSVDSFSSSWLLLVCGFCICRFSYLRKLICNPKAELGCFPSHLECFLGMTARTRRVRPAATGRESGVSKSQRVLKKVPLSRSTQKPRPRVDPSTKTQD